MPVHFLPALASFSFGLCITGRSAEKVQTVLSVYTFDISFFSVCLSSSRLLFYTRVSLPRAGDE